MATRTTGSPFTGWMFLDQFFLRGTAKLVLED
jgi:hypothetical protein